MKGVDRISSYASDATCVAIKKATVSGRFFYALKSLLRARDVVGHVSYAYCAIR